MMRGEGSIGLGEDSGRGWAWTSYMSSRNYGVGSCCVVVSAQPRCRGPICKIYTALWRNSSAFACLPLHRSAQMLATRQSKSIASEEHSPNQVFSKLSTEPCLMHSKKGLRKR